MEDGDREQPPEGAVETALWCNHCMLPSGVKWHLSASAAGMPIGKVGVIVCMDCGSRLRPDGSVIGSF